ncbi:UDP-N-acetylmuramoyl-L-alanine--D-glutamate ligase [Cyanobium sp. HWJ4-Hawea]|uniref:UDP-N-acetylmuramoyl-L-alanine--D-glutamate ligase n=1 Tax=Cyanobium sp. HWJ4-Hawea TaxID=2823713 RepID=UPI0020CE23D5|nr:UDP-N-acetylmuramoyl-L-alanine--D-glutamate ligase [Cyanobium sp. HWJ4-Hawea]MCP9807962.1 UDP-N-acetylmuramoyl-L-alanine--D-glutamate ligase [Cyanobium sp. HWJ4-Hawea]
MSENPGAAAGLTVVVGLGRSGRGAAKLLRQQGEAVLVIDSQGGPEQEALAGSLRQLGIAVELAKPLTAETFTALATRPNRVVVSPGIPWDQPTLVALRQQGVAVEGEVAVAWRASTGSPWIGITGTNGKTTVTHLISHLLQSAGLDAPMAGNVGFSAAELVLERLQPGQSLPQWMVVELSSYQIEAAAQVAPKIGIWTTLTPDHLERHGNLDNYRAIKRSLLERSEVRILNGDDPDLLSRASSWDRATWVTAGPRLALRSQLPEGIGPALWIEGDGVWRQGPGGPEHLMAADCLAMPGAHNRQNLLLAAAACLEAGLSGQQMEKAFRHFPGVPHRLERLGCHRGATYFNDSKATNYDAAEVALKALQGPLVVLAGGASKQGDANGWIEGLKAQARAVVLFGAAQQEFAALLDAAGYGGTVVCCPELAAAVTQAAALAARLGCPEVVLSPACASFDQYSDFEARGDHFRQLVASLPDKD